LKKRKGKEILTAYKAKIWQREREREREREE